VLSPTFTVVVPAHNSARTVKSAIRSVLQQTRPDFELIVVDDGSTDETAACVESFSHDARVRLISQPQRGPGAARNTAIRAGVGELVSMLDADDLWLPSYLEQMDRALRDDPQAGFAYTNAWVLDDPPGRIRRKPALWTQPEVPLKTPRELMLRLARRNFVYTAVTIRRSVLDEVGLFDERFRNGEDLELWLRVASAGYRAAQTEGMVAVHRDHADSLTSSTTDAVTRAIDLHQTIAREHADVEVRQLAAAREALLQRELQRLTRPTAWQRAGRLGLALRATLGRRSLWLDRAPEEVDVLLANVCE
jgi:glycosyltransferase involved in cell wall biosynthesis